METTPETPNLEGSGVNTFVWLFAFAFTAAAGAKAGVIATEKAHAAIERRVKEKTTPATEQ